MAKRPAPGPSLFFRLLLFSALLLSLGGCRNASEDQRTLIVAAAISLRPVLSELESAFEAEHPGVDLVLHFASSGSLSLQIRNGAPIDVFCTAHPRHMQLLEESGQVDSGQIRELARNRLVLAWSPSGRDCFEEDLTRFDPEAAFRLLLDPCIERIAVGEPVAVPVGTYADEVLAAYQIREALDGRRILARDALQIRTYLANDRAQAGILYRTDARRLPSGTPSQLVPESTHQPIRYLAAPVKAGPAPELAAAYIDFLFRPQARRHFEQAGFQILNSEW